MKLPDAAAQGGWVECDRALPLKGVPVRVRGTYTPESVSKPVSMLQSDPLHGGAVRWSSQEWRGMVDIQSWWWGN